MAVLPGPLPDGRRSGGDEGLGSRLHLGRSRAEHTFVPEVHVQSRMCSRSTHEPAPSETRRPTHGRSTPTRLEVRDGCMDFEPEIGAESRVQQSIATDAIIGAI